MTREELEKQWRDAVFTVETEHGTATFRENETVGNGDVLPPCRSITVVTAFNPDGEVRSPAENESAHQRLLDYLGDQGFHFTRANGAAADGSHEEKSVGVYDLTEDEARALGAAFGQACVMYWDGARARLLWMQQ
ncbi:MAG TPA: DUF3293 domain-containing protein [Gammaproteobacteria bacterium]|nr:DUF3293 domain-containing protein [Gammaproteobacteria bacterium]